MQGHTREGRSTSKDERANARTQTTWTPNLKPTESATIGADKALDASASARAADKQPAAPVPDTANVDSDNKSSGAENIDMPSRETDSVKIEDIPAHRFVGAEAKIPSSAPRFTDRNREPALRQVRHSSRPHPNWRCWGLSS